MKIAVIFDASGPMAVREDHLQQLSTACPDAEIRFSKDPAELIEAEFQADVLICWATGGKFSCGDYCRFDQQLKWIHCLSSGTEGLMSDPVSAQPGLLVTCSKGIHGVPMANHVMGYMLAFLRRFPELAANQKKHTWVRPMPDEATGKRICIIGMGNIGQEIARVAKTFDMFVTGIRRTQTPVEFVDEIRPTEALDAVLAEADFTIMLLPIPSPAIALLFAALTICPVIGVVNKDECMKELPWEVLTGGLMFPVMGGLINDSGVGAWMMNSLLGWAKGFNVVVLIIISTVVIWIINSILVNSQSAIITVSTVALCAMAGELGVNPVLFVMPSILVYSLRHVLGMQLDLYVVNGYGYWDQKDTIVPGLISSIPWMALIIIGSMILVPLAGL